MTEAPTADRGPSRGARIALVLGVLIPALALDLWTKAWAWEHLRTQPGREIVKDFFYLDFAFNTGSAFGFLRDAGWSRLFFIAITVAALVYMARLAMTLPTRAGSGFVAIGLIASGALGNLHDRFVRVFLDQYGVVDFIVVYYWPGKRWPAFNIADAALVAGVLLFMIYLRRHGDPAAPPKPVAA
ncbi:MAG: signal peptidase II [Myxococcales bacterium]|nr:signal peptidase II [Myxococcales bacterium]